MWISRQHTKYLFFIVASNLEVLCRPYRFDSHFIKSQANPAVIAYLMKMNISSSEIFVQSNTNTLLPVLYLIQKWTWNAIMLAPYLYLDYITVEYPVHAKDFQPRWIYLKTFRFCYVICWNSRMKCFGTKSTLSSWKSYRNTKTMKWAFV